MTQPKRKIRIQRLAPLSNEQIEVWFKLNTNKDKFKAGIPTFTALEVLKLLTRFNSVVCGLKSRRV